MFIGSFAFSVFTGTMPFLYPLAFLPLILLFTYKATKENPYRNATITAALLAYQIISGGIIHFLWSFLGVGLLLGVYGIFSLIKLNKSELVKIAAVGVIIIVFTLGFSAVKLLPAFEFNKLTDRAEEGVSYEDFIWTHTQVTLSKIPSAMFGTGVTMMRTGIVIFLLALVGFVLSFKKKYVISPVVEVFAAVRLGNLAFLAAHTTLAGDALTIAIVSVGYSVPTIGTVYTLLRNRYAIENGVAKKKSAQNNLATLEARCVEMEK